MSEFASTYQTVAVVTPSGTSAAPTAAAPTGDLIRTTFESKEALRQRAEIYVKQRGHVFPGVRPLAVAINCPASSLSKAIADSSYLKARKAEHDDRRKRKPREQPLTEIHLDRVQQSTEADPSETLDSLVEDQEVDDRNDERMAKVHARGRSR